MSADEQVAIPVEVKVWWQNYTLWTNVVAVTTMILTQFFGINVDPKLAAGILAIINVVLQAPRMSSTKERAEEHNKAIRARMVR